MPAKRKTAFTLMAAGLIAVLAWGLLRLFTLRFAAGDVYPPYSTLRADPLGARAFYESLAELPPLAVERNFRPVMRLAPEPGVTVVLAGVQGYGLYTLDYQSGNALRDIAARGGRVVMSAFEPNLLAWSEAETEACTNAVCRGEDEDERKGKRSEDEDEKKKGEGQEGTCASCEGVPFRTEQWGFRVRSHTNAWEDMPVSAGLAHDFAGGALPPTLPWHGGLYFDQLSNGWEAVYHSGGDAVIIQHRLGRGSMVCMADSYLLSNEALQQAREPAVLAWLIGPAQRVIFDETHLGLSQAPTVGTLIRKYRLQGALAAVLLLAVLYVWRASTALVPPPPAGTGGGSDIVLGRDSAAGLVNLLRRSIPPRQLLAQCVTLWVQAAGAAGERRESAVRQVLERAAPEGARPAAGADATERYRKICAVLKERK